MVLECDILVVGAGPSGASAAISAAKGGAKTILIDKKKEVGVPVHCAEGIGKYLFPYLPFKIPKAQLKWNISGISFWANETCIKKEGEFWEGYTVDRIDFDRWLVNLAITEGANLKLDSELVGIKSTEAKDVKNVRVDIAGNIKEIRPKTLIAADGSEMSVLKLLGHYQKDMEKKLGEGYLWEMKNLSLDSPNFEQIFLGDFAPGAYGYIFPKSKNSANVGVGLYKSKRKIKDCFSDFLELEVIKKQTKNADFYIEKNKKVVMRDLLEEWIIGNVIFCGDAVNHNLKPFVEGILPAMISGTLAGNLARDTCVNNQNALHRDYFNNLMDILGNTMDHSKKIFEIHDKIITDYMGKDRDIRLLALLSKIFELEQIEFLENMNRESIINRLLDKELYQ